MNSKNERQSAVDFVESVRVNQEKLRSGLKSQYDFIVCGSGPFCSFGGATEKNIWPM